MKNGTESSAVVSACFKSLPGKLPKNQLSLEHVLIAHRAMPQSVRGTDFKNSFLKNHVELYEAIIRIFISLNFSSLIPNIEYLNKKADFQMILAALVKGQPVPIMAVPIMAR